MNESHAMVPTLHRVTLVEDDERLAAATKEYLQTQGFAVRVASRGDTAVDPITSEPPNLVVLDLLLPGLDAGTADQTRHIDDMAFDINELNTLLEELLTYARHDNVGQC